MAEQVINFRKHHQELLEKQTASSCNPKEMLDDIAWAVLQVKLNQLQPSMSSREPPLPIAEIIKLFGKSPSSPSTIPSSVLSVAPHLSTLSDQVFIDVMQLQLLVDPIPHTLW